MDANLSSMKADLVTVSERAFPCKIHYAVYDTVVVSYMCLTGKYSARGAPVALRYTGPPYTGTGLTYREVLAIGTARVRGGCGGGSGGWYAIPLLQDSRCIRTAAYVTEGLCVGLETTLDEIW